MTIRNVTLFLTSALIWSTFCEVFGSDENIRDYLSKHYQILMNKKASALPCSRCMSSNFHWVSCFDCWSQSKSFAPYYEGKRKENIE